ncbi:NAD dependent epimerase/dehydratase [Tricladium varicosporioides]|nr:NAD dependent epimerase/dehydratase [Hymenoscyphus varicosporioides]
MSQAQTILVTGATGSQGFATAQSLLRAKHKVHAFVRDSTKPAAKALELLGAELFIGSFEDIPSITAAAQSCTGIFILTRPTMPFMLETEHCKNMIQAAKSAGIRRCVVSTVTLAESYRDFWHLVEGNSFMEGYWEAKSSIQSLVESAGFKDWTITQPAWLMTNLISPGSDFYFPDLKQEKKLVVAWAEDTKIQLTAPEDVGRFAGRFLGMEDGWEEMLRRRVRIASEELDVREICGIIKEVGDVDVGYRIRSETEIEEMKNVVPMCSTQWWQRVWGTGVDLEEVKHYGIKLTGLREFLRGKADLLLNLL